MRGWRRQLASRGADRQPGGSGGLLLLLCVDRRALSSNDRKASPMILPYYFQRLPGLSVHACLVCPSLQAKGR